MGRGYNRDSRPQQPHEAQGDMSGNGVGAPLIGGIAPSHGQYDTCYSTLTSGMGTSASQMTVQKQNRIDLARGKSLAHDPVEANRVQRQAMRELQAQAGGDTAAMTVSSSRGGGANGMGKSFISNLGASLAGRSDLTFPLPPKEQQEQQASNQRGSSKVLLVENYNAQPGYTGRKMI